jgi:cytidylate kinase
MKSDKRRNAFYNMRAHHKWDNMSAYDLCLNSGKLGISGCVNIITRIIEKRG